MVRRADAKAQGGLTEVGGRLPSLDQSIEASGDAADAILVPHPGGARGDASTSKQRTFARSKMSGAASYRAASMASPLQASPMSGGFHSISGSPPNSQAPRSRELSWSSVPHDARQNRCRE